MDDEAAVMAMTLIIAKNPGIAPWDAANRVAKIPGVAGDGTPDNTARRLHRKFRESGKLNLQAAVARDLQPLWRALTHLNVIGKMSGGEDPPVAAFIAEANSFQADLSGFLDRARAWEQAVSISGINFSWGDLRRLLARPE
jgi:hypothetical protein